MKILIDESLPKYLKVVLKSHVVKTVQEQGWAGYRNGDLLVLANERFDIFLTADRNIRFQQNLRNLNLAIVVFPSNKLSVIKGLAAVLQHSLARMKPGKIIELRPTP